MESVSYKDNETQETIETNDNDKEFKPGRPRSEKSRKSILDATRRLLTHTPLGELSIEAIAKKAKVGKTTIYRWWPNKASIAMEAFTEQPGIQHIVPSNTDPAESITKMLENLVRQLRGQNGRIISGIIAESQANEEVLDLLYQKFLKERVETLFEKIETGKQNGQFKKDIDTDIAIDMMLGPLFLRILSGEHGIDNSFAERYPVQAVNALKV
jgi:AcrR family transcriptional regulator